MVSPEDETDTAVERAEAAKVRRRWVTLGEGVAVAGVLIAGLGLWNSYRERVHTEERDSKAARQEGGAPLFLIGKAARSGERLTLTPGRADQAIQSMTIAFPAALDIAPIRSFGADAAIDANAIDDALRAARKAAGLPAHIDAQQPLPALIETRSIADGRERTDTALYTIAYTVEDRLVGGAEVKLRGFALASRGGGKAKLDAAWTRLQPTISSGLKK